RLRISEIGQGLKRMRRTLLPAKLKIGKSDRNFALSAQKIQNSSQHFAFSMPKIPNSVQHFAFSAQKMPKFRTFRFFRTENAKLRGAFPSFCAAFQIFRAENAKCRPADV